MPDYTQRDTRPFVLSGPSGLEGAINCPVCGFDYTHVSDVNVIPGFDDYRATRKVRGDVIKISMYCESRHTFDVMIGFHKGQNYVWCEPTGEIPDEDWEPEPPDLDDEPTPPMPGEKTGKSSKELTNEELTQWREGLRKQAEKWGIPKATNV